MSEPDLIRSSAPHSVSVSEGSKVAGGKKPGAAEHSVRRTLAGDDQAPVQLEDEPELKLSPRITPVAAPGTPDLPPPAPAPAEQGSQSHDAPPAFHSQSEPEDGVLLDQRSIQDDVQSLGDLPEHANTLNNSLVHLPESPAQPAPQQEAAAPPTTERVASENRIALPESAATGDEPQAEAPVLKRTERDHRAQLPESLAEPAGAAQTDAPVLERSQSDAMAAVPESLAALPTQETEGPIASRSSIDSVVELPHEPAKVEAQVEGPLISRAENDTLVAVPEAAASQADAEGLPVTRSESDNMVAVPEAAPGLVSEPVMPPPASAREELDVSEASALQSEYVEIPEIVELPEVSDQAQALPAATGPLAALAAPVLQPSEHQMVQMNFPARVIKLKIANDKVRVQLDSLDAPERPGR